MASLTGLPITTNENAESVDSLADRLAARLRLSRYSFYLALLISIFILLHMVKSYFMGLQVDEANWWMQISHLQAGYFFHPPFIVYELFMISKIFGQSLLALRIGSIFFTSGSLLLIYLLYREMFGDERGAFWVTLVIAILPITNFWLMLAIQDSPFVFLSLLTTLLIWRAISRDNKNYWYLIGVSAGFMLLCKLQASLLLPCLLLFFLSTKENRHWLRRKEPYLALLIVVLMFIPTMLWYASRHFEPITYQLGNRPGFLTHGVFGYTGFVLDHILLELLVLTPFVYIFSIFGMIYGGYLGYSVKGGRDRRFQLLFSLSAPIILFFTLTGGPPYWAVVAHFISLIAAAAALPVLISRTSWDPIGRPWRYTLIAALIVIPLLFTLGVMTTTVSDHVRNEYRWLAEKVEEERLNMPTDETYFAGAYYFVPSEVAYYERDQFTGYTLLFQVYEHVVIGAGNSTYSPWVDIDDLIGKNFIFVDAERNPDDYNTPISYWEQKLPPYFDHVDEPVMFSFKKWGTDMRTFYIFKCYGFKGPDPDLNQKGDVEEYVDEHA